MDSFYDQPRNAPIPTSIDQIPSGVPEVSIIMSPDINLPKQKKSLPAQSYLSYNVWKTQNASQMGLKKGHNKENIVSDNELEHNSQNICKVSSRKHVRFNSPQVQKHILEQNSITYDSDKNVNKVNKQEQVICNNEKNKAVVTKPFEQIYMANIPNRNLDLSIIEPFNLNKSSISENKEQKSCDKSTNMFRFHKNSDDKHLEYKNEESYDPHKNCYKYSNLDKSGNYQLQKHNYDMKTSNYNKQDIDNEPTVKELLKVVQQQNEQIILLQKQVSLLLQNQSKQKQIEAPETGVPKETLPHLQNSINGTEKENIQCDQCHNTKGTLSKFAIGVMTSFEVSVRPPNISRNKLFNDCYTSPKIEEILDMEKIKYGQDKFVSDNVTSDSTQKSNNENEAKQSTDLSLTLDKPLQIIERCPSPENSIHVDMKDYSSDSDDDSTGSSNDIGWTVYNNIMGQVNNILEKANGDLKDIKCGSNSNIVGDKTLRKVKDATMRHLKNIGVNLPVIDEPDNLQGSNHMVNGSEYTKTEISFAVKQLLMKYLPDDQLAKITHTPKENVKCNIENLIKRRPEFSFATVQYMKKYNLLTSDTVHQEQLPPHKNTNIPKILDVTALKQQPKLL